MSNYQKPNLYVLNNVPDKFLRKEEVASALQSFETSLFLISENSWATVIILLKESCEKLLRVLYKEVEPNPRNDKDINNKILDEWFCNKYGLDKLFLSRLEVFNNLRNTMTHRGYSPKDDHTCIFIYFDIGFSYLNKITNQLFNKKIEELTVSNTYQGGWFWDIFKSTTNVIKKNKLRNEDRNNQISVFYLSKAIQKIWRAQQVNMAYSWTSTYQWVISEHYQDTAWEVRQSVRNYYIKQLEKLGHCHEMIEYRCPICDDNDGGELKMLVSIVWGGKNYPYIFENIKGIACPSCEYLIIDQDLINEFVINKLTESEREKMSQFEEYEEAETINIGFEID